MTVAELMSKKTTLSFEVFPPKDGVPLDKIRETIRRLAELGPDFFSCTFGAGGTARGRNAEVCDIVSSGGGLAVPHLVCIGSSRAGIREIAEGYRERKLANILALRGDFPEGRESAPGDFAYASELIAFLSAEFPGLCIGAAGYPETHLRAASAQADIDCLRAKQDSGAAFVMTQLCYDAEAFERYLGRIRKAGVTIPVAAGIMPVLAYDPTIRMTISNGCSIPADLAALLGRRQSDPEGLAKAGAEYTAGLIRRFAAAGANGLHVYSMNRWGKIAEILQGAGLAG